MTLFTPNGKLLPLPQFLDALKAGADPNEHWVGDTSRIPLFEAAKGSFHHLRHLLTDPRTRVNIVDRDGASPLIVALKYNHVRAIHVLLTCMKQQVNQPDRYGATPLHHAVHNEGDGVLRQLLSAGADPNSHGPYGRTPLMELLLEHSSEHATIEGKARVLMSKGADPNLCDDNGRTALHAAAVSGYHHVIDALLEFGADADRRSRDGLTPLQEASSRRAVGPFQEPFQRIVQRLAQHNRGRLQDLVPKDIQRSMRVEERRAL